MASVLDGVNRLTQLVGRNRLELLMFRLGSQQRFGINVFKVREVIKCPPLTKVPHSHHLIRGIANMRGRVITVIDLSAAVGMPPLDMSQPNSVIVTEYNRQIQGLLVSHVERIVNKNWETINPPPKGIGHYSYLTAVTNVDNQLVEIIDVEKVLAEVIDMKLDVSKTFTEEVAASASAEHHVFVVDDSAVARKQIVRVLDQLNLKYTMAENGREAWEKLLAMAGEKGPPMEQRISMVISDIEMPEMDGYTLTKRIREHPALEKLHVLLHTSLSGSFNEMMVKRVKADHLLAKYDANELARIVVEHLHALDKENPVPQITSSDAAGAA
jgi:two-component system chemotaxis response regulator CheV